VSTTNKRTTQQTSKKKRTSKTKTEVITEIRKNEEINSPMNIDYKKNQDEYKITTKRYIFISISVLILLFATFGTLIIFYLNRRKFIVIRNSDASSNDTNTIEK
jgi:ATP-dependent Zn protease